MENEEKLSWKFIRAIVCLSVAFLALSETSTGTKSCKNGFGQHAKLNYSLPMFIECRQKQLPNGSMVKTIPKLITASSTDGSCHRRNSTLGIPLGHRVCRIPDCDANPCENGWCEETLRGYVCHCPVGFQGERCSEKMTRGKDQMTTPTSLAEANISHNTNINEYDICTSNPCLNGGTCSVSPGHTPPYTCQCDLGYYGTECEYDICCSNPCLNGGTCSISPSHTPPYTCQCDLGYHGTECDVSVELLIVNPQKTGIWTANLSDLVFSELVDFGSSAKMKNFVYDDKTDRVYWMNLISGHWSIFYSSMTFDIRSFEMGATNWTILSDRNEALMPCLDLDVMYHNLYWSAFLKGLRRRDVGEGLLAGIVSYKGKDDLPEGATSLRRCVIDRRRRFFYYTRSVMGFKNFERHDLDTGTHRVIVKWQHTDSLNGLTMDEERERLFWTSRAEIWSFDVKNEVGPHTVVELEGLHMRPGSIVFIAGWLVWYDRAEDQVCAALAEADAGIKLCRFTSEDGLPRYISSSLAKELALRGV